jgi:uncharacterized protein (DUF983 family)
MSFRAMLMQKCPRCEKGNMFQGIFKMNETCPHCQLKFEREEGYYSMAIVFANFLYALVVAPTLLTMTTLNEPVWDIVLILGSFSLISIPIIFRAARSIWLHFDFKIHPE